MIGKAVLQMSKHSPALCLVAGIACGVGALALTVKATLDTKKKIEEVKEEVVVRTEKLESEIAKNINVDEEVITDDNSETTTIEKKDTKKQELFTPGERLRNNMYIAKKWLPVIALSAASIVLLVKGYSIMNKRVAALTAAYAALEERFNSYREKVAEKYGEEEEAKISKEADKQLLEYPFDESWARKDSPYLFDESTSELYPDPADSTNILSFSYFADMQLTNILRKKGYLYLNDALEAYGLEPRQFGKMVGWYIPKGDNPDTHFVTSGLVEMDPVTGKARLSDPENTTMLRFNVDGIIFDKMTN